MALQLHATPKWSLTKDLSHTRSSPAASTTTTDLLRYEFEAAGAKMSAALAAGAAVLALFSGPAAAIVVAVAGIMYLQSEMGHLRCSFTYF